MTQPAFNFQGSAAFAILAFLGTGLVLALVTGATVYFLAKRRPALARQSALAALIIVGVYSGTLLVFSVTSRDQVLGPNDEKYFCEVDCHLAYSVVAVQTAKTLGAPLFQKTAKGEFYVVTLKVRFDENTISSRRPKDAPLSPNPRTVAVLDSRGNRYVESLEGEEALGKAEGRRIPLTQPLRPGDSYTTRLVFDIPPGIQDPRLDLRESFPVTHFLIGHENSFFHRKATFRLSPQAEPART